MPEMHTRTSLFQTLRCSRARLAEYTPMNSIPILAALALPLVTLSGITRAIVATYTTLLEWRSRLPAMQAQILRFPNLIYQHLPRSQLIKHRQSYMMRLQFLCSLIFLMIYQPLLSSRCYRMTYQRFLYNQHSQPQYHKYSILKKANAMVLSAEMVGSPTSPGAVLVATIKALTTSE